MTATYRTLIIGGALMLLTSAAWRPDLAIFALTALTIGFAMRSERWRAEWQIALKEKAGAEE